MSLRIVPLVFKELLCWWMEHLLHLVPNIKQLVLITPHHGTHERMSPLSRYSVPCDAVDTDCLRNRLSCTINITAFTNECHRNHYRSTIAITSVGNAGWMAPRRTPLNVEASARRHAVSLVESENRRVAGRMASNSNVECMRRTTASGALAQIRGVVWLH